MGVVFRARDVRLGREVALKCPWPALVGAAAVRGRFFREAQSTSRLSHPNIVPVFEIFSSRGLPWIVMELVDGLSLRERLREDGALPVKQALRWGEGLSDALWAAHSKGIVHRDVNPNNILIRADGWPLLTDFGLARLAVAPGTDTASTVEDLSLTAPGQVVGTRSYMSPEQALGKPVDGRSDIFSLGAVIYEMSTGRRAFPPEEGVLDAILHRDPPPMLSLKPELPEELERIVRTSLAKRREERYQDARELSLRIADLRRRVELAEYGPTPTPTPALPTPSSAPTPRPRFPKYAAWGAGLAALALAALAIVERPRGPRPSDGELTRGRPRQLTSDPGWEAEPALSPDGSLVAYTSNASGNPDIWITDLLGGSRLRLTDDPGADRSPTWFPDGSALAFVSDRGGRPGIWKVPRLGGSPILILPGAVDPALSPDGTRIAFARVDSAITSRILVATLADPTRAEPLTAGHEGDRFQKEPAWAPDGRAVCYADARNLWLAGLEGGRVRRLTRDNAVDFDPVFSPDGRVVVFSSLREGTLALWRIPVEGGAPERLTVGTGPESQASFSRDGSRLTYSTFLDNYDVALLEPATGRTGVIGGVLYESAPSLAPDGSAVVFASTRRGGQHDLWLQALSGARLSGQPRQLTDLAGTVNTPAFSPDGRWVAFKREVEGHREIWVIGRPGSVARRFSDGEGNDLHPAWSPDGTHLAYVSERAGGRHIWTAPIRDGQRAGPGRQITSGDTMDLLPAWSWDGSKIAFVASRHDEEQVQVVPAGGGSQRTIATRSGLGRLRWERPSGLIWFAAAGPGGPRLWKVSSDGGDPVLAEGTGSFGGAAPEGDFDVTPDGGLLAYTSEEIRGDIWVLEDRAEAHSAR